MDSLNLPSILSPDLGLLFWMLVAFLIVFILLSKFGFPVIVKMVEERKQYINDSLQKARDTHERMAQLKTECERMLKETHEQQAKILLQANETGSKIVEEARYKAQVEGAKIITEARTQIVAEREAALQEIKNIVASLSIEISEKVIRKSLADDASHEAYINRLLDEVQVPQSKE